MGQKDDDSSGAEWASLDLAVHRLKEDLAQCPDSTHDIATTGDRLKELQSRCEDLAKKLRDAEVLRDIASARMQAAEPKVQIVRDNADKLQQYINGVLSAVNASTPFTSPEADLVGFDDEAKAVAQLVQEHFKSAIAAVGTHNPLQQAVSQIEQELSMAQTAFCSDALLCRQLEREISSLKVEVLPLESKIKTLRSRAQKRDMLLRMIEMWEATVDAE